jgi:hypothetical protein
MQEYNWFRIIHEATPKWLLQYYLYCNEELSKEDLIYEDIITELLEKLDKLCPDTFGFKGKSVKEFKEILMGMPTPRNVCNKSIFVQ